jgi:hypothetical protein
LLFGPKFGIENSSVSTFDNFDARIALFLRTLPVAAMGFLTETRSHSNILDGRTKYPSLSFEKNINQRVILSGILHRCMRAWYCISSWQLLAELQFAGNE